MPRSSCVLLIVFEPITKRLSDWQGHIMPQIIQRPTWSIFSGFFSLFIFLCYADLFALQKYRISEQMTSFWVSFYFTAAHYAFSGDDATEPEICSHKSYIDGDLCNINALESLRWPGEDFSQTLLRWVLKTTLSYQQSVKLISELLPFSESISNSWSCGDRLRH